MPATSAGWATWWPGWFTNEVGRTPSWSRVCDRPNARVRAVDAGDAVDAVHDAADSGDVPRTRPRRLRRIQRRSHRRGSRARCVERRVGAHDEDRYALVDLSARRREPRASAE